jgi:hypothetical protein
VLGWTWKFADDVRKTNDGMRSRRNPKSSIPSGQDSASEAEHNYV